MDYTKEKKNWKVYILYKYPLDQLKSEYLYIFVIVIINDIDFDISGSG